MTTLPIIALLYDFDRTLSPKDMQEDSFIPSIGMPSAQFWHESNGMAEAHHMDKVLAYMYLMLKKSKEKGRSIRREAFQEYGRSVELFPGVPQWFDRVNEYGACQGYQIHHYIISSGLMEIIEGTEIARFFKAIFASAYYYDETGAAQWPALAVNYTSKTQYLFRINKGILDVNRDEEVNAHMPDSIRPVTFPRMIYLGDGFTDVPCMKLVRENGGHSIAVYQGQTNESIAALMKDDRVDCVFPADYRTGSALDQYVHHVIDKITANDRIQKIYLEQKEAISAIKL